MKQRKEKNAHTIPPCCAKTELATLSAGRACRAVCGSVPLLPGPKVRPRVLRPRFLQGAPLAGMAVGDCFCYCLCNGRPRAARAIPPSRGAGTSARSREVSGMNPAGGDRILSAVQEAKCAVNLLRGTLVSALFSTALSNSSYQ